MDYQAGVREGPGPMRIHAIDAAATADDEDRSLCKGFPLLAIGDRFDVAAVYACRECCARVKTDQPAPS